MTFRLYVVHGSHPCLAVERALQLKGLDYKVWEWPPPLHAPMQKLLFGARTVPAIVFGKGDKLSGSTAIMRRLDEMVPEPRLFPTESPMREKVEEAERFGYGDFQQVARDLIWVALRNNPDAMLSYTAGSHVKLPAPVVKANAPLITRAQTRLNHTDEAKVRQRLAALPAQFDQIDAWIAEGVIGDADHPNAADLQVLSTVRLMGTMGDVRTLLDGRPCDTAARALYPQWAGELPAGALPAAKA